jgi:hypothetical protein
MVILSKDNVQKLKANNDTEGIAKLEKMGFVRIGKTAESNSKEQTDYSKWAVDALREEATAKGISNPRKISKKELIGLLSTGAVKK